MTANIAGEMFPLALSCLTFFVRPASSTSSLHYSPHCAKLNAGNRGAFHIASCDFRGRPAIASQTIGERSASCKNTWWELQ